VIDPALLTRLAAILPGEWTAIRDGYSLATGADTLTVRTPGVQYLVRLSDGDALKSYEPADLAPLIRRALGDEVFTSLSDPTASAKAERDRRRSALCQLISDASLTAKAAQDALRQAEADLAAFDRENTP